jgi:restriction system protein
MPIPDFQSLMLPLLKLAGDREEHAFQAAVGALAEQFGLTKEERLEPIASGPQPVFTNRVGWARTYMVKAGLLRSSRRAHFEITELGLQVLSQEPAGINIAFLKQFPEFVEFQKGNSGKPGNGGPGPTVPDLTPEEAMEAAHQVLVAQLADELIATVKSCSPAFFERLVVELLVKMGYGGTLRDAAQAIGRPGDEGIDGIIKEDRLGLDVVYVQAKRWEGTVGRPAIQSFVGALHGQHARKGVFITTSDFAQTARDYARAIDSNVVLVDGKALARLMIDYNIGVASVATYELKRVDTDYFVEG